ncbi:MAG: type IV pilus modification protein PilV [Rhodanobacteraceae bacterium]|jgi:type IV pilus assembly protein PilV|nr:type IV pilus modification protein PilV [Rhodanobacteraceae bacterium]
MIMKTVAFRRGFTLLEVLIALLIFSVGMLGLAALQAYSVKTNQSAHLRSQATALANMMMDSIRANRQNVGHYYANQYVEFDCGTAPAASPPAQHDLEFWKQQVNCALPQGRGAVAPISANELAVCIRWSDARWESADGSAETSCAEDAATFGAGLEADGPGAGTDGQFSVFVVSSRF